MSLLKLARKVRTFFKIDNKKKKIFIKTFILTGINRYSILNSEFKMLAKKIGTSKKESSYEIDNESYIKAKEIGEIVKIVSKHTPWESLCLVQAMTAQKLLKEENISSTLYLGVKKENDNMVAHAWLRCGNYYVTGGNGYGYASVAKFSNEDT